MDNMTKLASIQQHYYAQGQAQAIAEAGLTKEAKAGKLKKLLALTGAGGAGAGIGMSINDAIKARMALMGGVGLGGAPAAPRRLAGFTAENVADMATRL